MNGDSAAGRSARAGEPLASSFEEPAAHPSSERRARSRRFVDRQIAALAALAGWFANHYSEPLLLIDDEQAVLFTNRAALRLLGSTKALGIHDGKLIFRSGRHQVELSRALGDSVTSRPLSLRVAGAPVTISVGPLHTAKQAGGVFMLTLTPAPRSQPEHEVLRRKLGLTIAEAHVAAAIFNGLSLVKIARQRSASINTVKTQARHIFQKCRVRSQTALVRRLGELLADSS